MKETTNSEDKEQLQSSWRIYLLEYEYAKHYNYTNILSSGSGIRNPILELLLPSLLLVRVVSILDEALQLELRKQGLKLPQGKYKDNLKGRIGILGENKTLSKSDELQTLRRRRNDIAHDLSFTNWKELSSDIDLVEFTLQELKLVKDRPKLEYFGERSAIKESTKPNVLFTREYRCGIKENGHIALEHTWAENCMKDNSD